MYIRSVRERLQSCIVTVSDGTWLKSLREKPCENGHKSVRLVVEFTGEVKAHPRMTEAPRSTDHTP